MCSDNLTNLKSLRKGVEQKDSFENFGVSPSFQNYVAKKLDEIIEKCLLQDNIYGIINFSLIVLYTRDTSFLDLLS